MSQTKETRQVLTIAGSDSSGGAGIQADLKTFAALHTYGSSVITALTAQNTKGVDAIEATSPDFVAQQLKTTMSDLNIKCAKTGMLANAAVIRAVAQVLNNYKDIPLVIDPVMVSTSGHTLLESEAISTLKEFLMPLATLITPNLPEGCILAGRERATNHDLSESETQDICRKIAKQGPSYVLLKGGHSASQGILDIFYDKAKDSFTTFRHSRLDTKNTHGTGCTLSAAICAFVAQDYKPLQAVEKALRYLQGALQSSYTVGSGSGPVNHMHSTALRPLAAPTPDKPTPLVDYLLSACRSEWEDYVWENAFIQGVRDATLPVESFVHFLKQDYVFLKHYARVFALAAYKADTFEEMRNANDIAARILQEVNMHEKFCEKFGTSVDEFEREEMGTVAYTRFVLDVAHSKSTLHLRCATAPCLLGYADAGRRLAQDPKTVKGDANPFWSWIEEYSSDWFQEASQNGLDLLEKMAQSQIYSQEQLADVCRVFETATRMEAAFFKQSVAVVQSQMPVQ